MASVTYWSILKYMFKIGKRQAWESRFKSPYPVTIQYERLYEEGFHNELTRREKAEFKKSGIPMIGLFDPDWRPEQDILLAAYQVGLGIIEDEMSHEEVILNHGTARDPDNLWEGFEYGSEPEIFVYKIINDPQVQVRVKFKTSIGHYYKMA